MALAFSARGRVADEEVLERSGSKGSRSERAGPVGSAGLTRSVGDSGSEGHPDQITILRRFAAAPPRGGYLQAAKTVLCRGCGASSDSSTEPRLARDCHMVWLSSARRFPIHRTKGSKSAILACTDRCELSKYTGPSASYRRV